MSERVPTRSERERAQPDPGRILVADDSAVARAVVERELRSAGHEVLLARDGAEAVARARAEAPDVILLDVEMPGLDGFATLRALAGEPATAEIPVVFLTGIDEAGTAARGLAAGAHDYLRKPFEAVELCARVGAALRTKRLQDALRARGDELARLASTDVLTGISNRRHGAEQMAVIDSRSQRHDLPLSVILFDVDRFKSINDRLGHADGDAVLREIARRVGDRVRREDVFARWGGEEFLVVLPDVGPDGAATVAEALRAIVADAPIPTSEGPLAVTVSLGWASREGGRSADELVRLADAALYRAKESGRDRVCGATGPDAVCDAVGPDAFAASHPGRPALA